MMLRPLHIIMPMAGEGSRFSKAGWTTPKPLIMLNDIPLFRRAINSVHLDGVPMRYSFIVRQEHIDKYNIDTHIRSYFPDAYIFAVQKTTRGAVETCLLAKESIQDDEGIVVLDCDLEFSSANYRSLLLQSLRTPANEARGGALVSFESSLPKYSYAETDENGLVIRTAEKEVISSHALCGAYFFATGKRFIEVAQQLLVEPIFNKPEYYVSLLYNYLLRDGEPVKLATMEKYCSYGTPEELMRYMS